MVWQLNLLRNLRKLISITKHLTMSSKTATVEVERKFVCPTDIRDRLERLGAREIQSHSFTDCYYDTPTFSLTLADHWLRSRDGVWQLKSPPPDRTDSLTTAQYLETESQEGILEALGLLFGSCSSNMASIEELLRLQSLKVFAKFATDRKQFQFGDFLVVLDETDFGFKVGEVEKLVHGSDVQKATEEVDVLVKKLGKFQFKERNTTGLGM